MEKQDGITLIEKVIDKDNLERAMIKVRKNKGAPGVDGLTVYQLEGHMKRYYPHLIRKLKDGSYQPQPVRRVSIPKSDGTKRLLGIPSVLDRVVQQAILQVIDPIIDPQLSDNSYGFRKGRNAHQAIQKAEQYYKEGYRVVVDCDLKSYFDTIHHQKLRANLEWFIQDKIVLKLIWKFLKSGILDKDSYIETDTGAPQGGPLSPLLANVYLNQLDRELERRGHAFIRYADDFVIYVKSKRAGERVMESVTQFIEKDLRLTVNQKKSSITTPTKAKFLGFHIMNHMGKLDADLVSRQNNDSEIN
ncbi:MAG: group II intron reverse transcriptase/maturase [Carnobacterium jeotgali]|uniref:group II intron reverse transcriptase/maturase n=1 Tax=Carnobacterium jeotgali TaxID=545534 RepID=UPI0004939E3F|nr:group II intron reverse transcriptase/maturase [Carnobacterium jeotgali]